MQKVNDIFHEEKVFFPMFFFFLHLTSCHRILVLKLLLGVEMIDKKFWKCTLCSFKKNGEKNWDFQCQYLLNVEKMRQNALNLPHGIGG